MTTLECVTFCRLCHLSFLIALIHQNALNLSQDVSAKKSPFKIDHKHVKRVKLWF